MTRRCPRLLQPRTRVAEASGDLFTLSVAGNHQARLLLVRGRGGCRRGGVRAHAARLGPAPHREASPTDSRASAPWPRRAGRERAGVALAAAPSSAIASACSMRRRSGCTLRSSTPIRTDRRPTPSRRRAPGRRAHGRRSDRRRAARSRRRHLRESLRHW
jgi:hypothetical protein